MYRLPWSGFEVPHIVIEVNSVCNIDCKGCYKDMTGVSKSVSEIISEIELACSLRNLHLLTLAGGEPTLHPSLPEIIEYISRKGIHVGIVTNGMRLTDQQLKEFKKAGLTKIWLHIDSRQERPDCPACSLESDLNELRACKMKQITGNGLEAGLSITMDKDTVSQLPDIMDFLLSLPFDSDMLATCFKDNRLLAERYKSIQSKPAPTQLQQENRDSEVSLREVKTILDENCKMRPIAYLPSSHQLSTEKWLIYFSLTSRNPSGNMNVLHLQPPFLGRLIRISDGVHHALRGKHIFLPKFSSSQLALLGTAYALLSFRIDIIKEVGTFIFHSLKQGAKIRLKGVLAQDGPHISKNGELEICKDCPDATIRDGKIAPICLASHLPLSEWQSAPHRLSR